MKICFLMRSEFSSVHGGDVIQVENYKIQLESRRVIFVRFQDPSPMKNLMYISL